MLDAEFICLEIGEHCTGHLCPVCAVPPAAVDARLAKSGLRPEVRRKLVGHCEAHLVSRSSLAIHPADPR